MTSFGDVIEISENDNPIMLGVQTPSPLISPTDSNNSLSIRNQENLDTISLPRNFKGNALSDEISSAGSSLTELKRFLRDLPSPNEVTQLTDRVALLSRQKRRNRDVYLHLQDSVNRIEEKDEKEEREVKDAPLESETPANNFPKAEKSRDARARRRARNQAKYSQAENKEMVLTQRDSTSATNIVTCDERCEDRTASNKSSDGLVNKSTPLNQEVNFNETLTLDYANEIGSCKSCDVQTIENDYYEIVRGNFHPNTVTTDQNSQKKDDIYLTHIRDRTCHNYHCEFECECSLQGIGIQLPSPLSSDCNQSTKYDGCRPRGVILKNLSSESETEINKIVKDNSGRSMNDLELSSPPSKLQRDVGNITFVSARSEPTNYRRKVLQSTCSYMGNESTAHKGFTREMSLESLRTSRYQQPDKGNCTANIGATKPIEYNLTKQLDNRNQRIDLVSLLSGNNQQKKSGVITSRSMAGEASEILSVSQISEESHFRSKTVFDGNMKKVSHTSAVDRGIQNTEFHFYTNGKVTAESSKDIFKGINDTKKQQSELPIISPDSFKKPNEPELPYKTEPFNSLKSPAGRTKIPVKIKDSRNKNLVNVKDIKENYLSSFDKENSALVTLKENVFVTEPYRSGDLHNTLKKSGTSSARLHSSQQQTFRKLSSIKASTVPNSPSHVRDKLSQNIRYYQSSTVKNPASNRINPPQSKSSRCLRLDNKIYSANKALANIERITCDNITHKSHHSDNYDDHSKETEYNISQSPTKKDNCNAFTKSKSPQEKREHTSDNGVLKYKSDETLIVEDLEGSVLESDVESSETDQTSSDNYQSEPSSLENSAHNDMNDAGGGTYKKSTEADCTIYEESNQEGTVHLQGYNNTCLRISGEVPETEDTIIRFHKEVKEGDGELSPQMKSLSTATICINSGHLIRGTEESVTNSNEDSSTSANIHQYNDCMENVSVKDFQFEVNIGDSNVDQFPSEIYDTHDRHKKMASPSKKLRTSPRSVKFFSGFYQPSKRKGSKCENKSQYNTDNVPKFQGKCMTDNKQKNVHVESAKPISSDTTAFFVRGTRKITVLPATLSSSTSKLVFTDDAVKNSPRAKRKSQDRFPFTISKATSTMSSKFKLGPECNQPPNLDVKSTPREGAYLLDIHPSIMRLACKGYEETGYDVIKCVTYDPKIGGKNNLVPMMKGFVRKFSSKLRAKSKKHCPTATTEGTMKVIYKNKQCREESLENTSSDESLREEPSKNQNTANKLTDLHWPSSDSTASSKVLKKTESCEHIALNLEELSTRRHYNNAWIQDITDQETSPQEGAELWSRSRGSSGKSSNLYSKQNSKRYSMFLATNSRHTQTPECPQVTSIVEQDKAHCHKHLPMWTECQGELADKSSLPEDITTRRKGKKVPEIYTNDLEGVETGCFCLRFCHLVARFSTGTMSKNHISVRQRTSSARVNTYRLPLWKRTR